MCTLRNISNKKWLLEAKPPAGDLASLCSKRFLETRSPAETWSHYTPNANSKPVNKTKRLNNV